MKSRLRDICLLIKLDGVSAKSGFKETENYGRLEYSFYRLVRKCGIAMSECSLIEENGRAHFLTKRFDRLGHKKVHMQTLCGIAHYDFRLFHAYSYEQAFNVMRALRLPYNPSGEWPSAHRMSVNEKFDGISRDDILACGKQNNIKNAVEIIDEVCEAVATWPTLAKECGVPQSMIEQITPNMCVGL